MVSIPVTVRNRSTQKIFHTAFINIKIFQLSNLYRNTKNITIPSVWEKNEATKTKITQTTNNFSKQTKVSLAGLYLDRHLH
jgi:hypothetical protein